MIGKGPRKITLGGGWLENPQAPKKWSVCRGSFFDDFDAS